MQPRSARDLAVGRWPGLLAAMGMPSKYLTGKHTDCPLCSVEKKWFRIDDKNGRGTYICNACGSGDGFMLLERWKGWDFATAAKEIEKLAGDIKVGKVKAANPARDFAYCVKLWNQARDVVDGDQVTQYLRARGLALPSVPRSLRWHPGLEYKEGGKVIGKFPVMLAAIASPEGKVVALHRTYLAGCAKAPVDEPKKTLPGIGTISKCAIRLATSGVVLGVAEGIETALAAHERYGIPVWSCINTSGMESFVPPPHVKHVVIFADNDDNYSGHVAAYVLAKRLKLAGLEVEIEIPPQLGDWLDMAVIAA